MKEQTPEAGAPRSSLLGSSWSAEYVQLANAIRTAYGRILAAEDPNQLRILELHTGPACPSSCHFCPTHGAKRYPKERLRPPFAVEEIKLLLKDFASLRGETLILSGGLEPLTGPAIEAAAAASELRLQVHLYTSGLSNSLDSQLEREALLRSTHRIRFSVNGLSAETFGRVQLAGKPGGAALSAVLRRLELLATERRELGVPVELGLSFVVTEENARELEDVAAYCRAIGLDRFEALADIRDDCPLGSEVASRLRQLRRCADRYRPLRVRVSGRSGVIPAITQPCSAARIKVAVDPYGLVWRCCHVANPERSGPDFYLGDLRRQTLPAILASERAKPRHTGCTTCPDFERTVNALIATDAGGSS